MQLDHDLWFNWLDWYRLWLGHPWLLECGRIAYFSIYASPAIIVSHFAVTQQKMAARIFITTFWLAVVTTLLLFIFMPGAGPLAYLWHGAIPYMPTSALFQSQLIPLIRNHSVHTIDLGALRGLVCAPSFHTTCAVLYIITARKTGLLRWPLTLTNTAMLLSIPIEGTHYLIDMVGGAIVALTATWLVNTLVTVKD